MVDKDPKLHTWCKGIIVPSGLETVEKFPKISPRNFVFRIWRRSARAGHATLPNNSYDPRERNMTPQLGPAMFRILTETDSIDPCIVGLGRDLSIFCVCSYLNCFFQSTAIRREKKGGIIALADW